MLRAAFFILLFLASGYVSGSEDTTRVLFIGNSLTYTYDVPSLVKGLANASGLPFKCTMYAPPGATVGDTSQGSYAHMFNPEVFDAIRADNWDFVCLQDNQGRFILGHGRFPDPVAFKIIEGHFKIMDSVKYYHPCAHMLWFAGWVFKNGYAGLSTTGKGLIDNVYQNYVFLKDTAGEIISPIGIAWERAMVALPATDLWASDETHESLAGAYLTASVIFSSVFRRNIDMVPFNGGLDSTIATKLRQIAFQTVTDSSAANNLDAYSVGLSSSGNTLLATAGYTTYYWYLNGSLINTGTDNTLSMVTPGCYQVVAVNSDLCHSRSAEICIASLGLDNVHTGSGVKVYPVPTGDVINIELPVSMPDSKTITLIAPDGRIIRQYNSSNNRFSMSTCDITPGVYTLMVQGNAGVYRQKVVINK